MKIDKITLSISPKVWLTQYKGLQPHASVTFIPDPEAPLRPQFEQAKILLRKSFYHALLEEINRINDCQEVLGGAETTEELAALCMKEIADDAQVTVEQSDTGKGAHVQPVAHVPSVKAKVPTKVPTIKKPILKGTPIYTS